MKRLIPSLLALFAVLFVLAGCAQKNPAIDDGMSVKLNYKGTLSDGTVFDSSEGRDPLQFVVGAGQIIPGLEEGIKGLHAGDKKTITIAAANAYGAYDDSAVMEFPKDQLPQDMELTEGMQLAAQGPQGPIPVTIKEIKEDSVMIDFNHPLAGKDLIFDVEIVEVVKAEKTDQPEAQTFDPAFGTDTQPQDQPAQPQS